MTLLQARPLPRLLFFLAASLFIFDLPACSRTEDKGVAASEKFILVLVDKTDDPIIKANYAKAFSLVPDFLGLKGTRLSADGKRVDGSLDGHGWVIVGPVWETKQKFSPWVDQTLKKGTFNDNPLERQALVRDFLVKLDKGVDDALNSPYGSDRSAILYTLEEMSKIMANVKAGKKVLLVLSDMMENSDIVSFYKSAIRSNPKKVFEEVKSKFLIPKFDGVNIYVVSSGKTDDALSTKVEEFWKLYFAESGGRLLLAVFNEGTQGFSI